MLHGRSSHVCELRGHVVKLTASCMQQDAASGRGEAEGGAHLQHVSPVQHEVRVGVVRAQVRGIAHQETEVGLQELVAVVRLLAGGALPAAPAPRMRSTATALHLTNSIFNVLLVRTGLAPCTWEFLPLRTEQHLFQSGMMGSRLARLSSAFTCTRWKMANLTEARSYWKFSR